MSHTFQKSQDLFARAERSIAGGVNSGIRKLEKPVPLYFRSGKGCRLQDEDGNESIDFQTGQGALLFGHAPDGLAEAIAALARLGTHWHALGGPVPPRNRGGGAPAGDDSLRGADALQQLRHRGGELRLPIGAGAHGTVDHFEIRGALPWMGRRGIGRCRKECGRSSAGCGLLARSIGTPTFARRSSGLIRPLPSMRRSGARPEKPHLAFCKKSPPA